MSDFEFTVPVASPEDAPFTTITINDEWLSFLTGLCERMLAKDFWDDDDPAVRQRAEGFVYWLMDILSTED